MHESVHTASAAHPHPPTAQARRILAQMQCSGDKADSLQANTRPDMCSFLEMPPPLRALHII